MDAFFEIGPDYEIGQVTRIGPDERCKVLHHTVDKFDEDWAEVQHLIAAKSAFDPPEYAKVRPGGDLDAF